MSFTSAKEARMYAKMETVRTHRQHIVVPCKQYLCPPKTYFGQDFYPAFTVILGGAK